MNRITRSQLDQAATRLETLVGGAYGRGFYNQAEVLEAEEREGLSVPDAILGWILNSPPDAARGERTVNIATVVANHLVTRDVASMCHNLHAILAEFLVMAGVPAVSLWGSLHAEAPGEYLEFTLSPNVPRMSADHRPGHSWVITPEFSVLDIALPHQANVYQHYEELRDRIPSVISLEDRQTTIPEDRWIAPAERTRLLPEEREDAMIYFDVLGWVEGRFAGLTVRYVPSAVQIPDSDWNFMSSLPPIGGMNPGRFLRKRLKGLVGAAS